MAQSFNYDVFISFRGEDTRSSFTAHLCDTLCSRGIKAFVEDEFIRKGDEISPSLLKAIEESRIFVTVLSENYASSTWCLDELVKILACMVEKYHLVLPIFYKIEPSDARHQKNSYAQAMTEHEINFGKGSEKVLNWRSALSRVANLSGYHYRTGYEYEYELIENIVKNISTKLSRPVLHVGENIVGLDSCVEQVISLLDIWSHSSVSMLGIFGAGGIGKTTLAKVLYNLIADQFEYTIFLSDIREDSKKYENGLVSLQERLLSMLFEVEHVKLVSDKEGVLKLKNCLCYKRVLLILDDVDRMEQLEKLAGDCSWFGSGSRIIVTTRDRYLLNAHGIEKRYEMTKLNDQDAFKLFCWNAFNHSRPPQEFINMSHKIVKYASGLPLALKLTGSFLHAKHLVEWESALNKDKGFPDKHIQEVLRISYDGLEDNQKGIFLDIACFFKGYCFKDVQNTLDASYGDSKYHIGVLVEKSLITIDSFGHFGMHDIIQDMGRRIVIQEALEKAPQKCSRLWYPEDVVEVLQNDSGTDNIRGIMLESPQQKIQWSGTAFKKMTNLKILIVHNASFSVGPKYLPNSLQYLEWMQYPLTSFPSSFLPKERVFLRISYSLITLQKPIMELKSLVVMDFSYCHLIIELPDMSAVPQLRELNLSNCENLIKVHDSIGFHAKLVDLSLQFCTNLRILPRGIQMTSLERLMISGCVNLERFPDILGNMDCLLRVDAESTAIKELPNSIGKLTRLEYLNLMASSLVSLPRCMKQLSYLKYLNVSNCKNLREICEVPSNLGEIYAENCTSLPLRSANVLWSQVMKEVSPMRILMPGAQIPGGFDLRCEGEVLSFWARRKFPAAVFAAIHSQYVDWEKESMPIVKLHLFINHVEVNAAEFFPAHFLCEDNEWHAYHSLFPAHFLCEDNEWHAYLQDLRTAVSGGEDWKDLDRYFSEQEWNYVELKLTESEMSLDISVSQCGLYVYRQETNMEDIQFQPPSSTMSVGLVPRNVQTEEATFHLESDPHEQLVREPKPGGSSRTETRDESIQRQLTELLGIDIRCEQIELLLEKFPVVGIWGISGIGKTTIAKVVFAKLSSQFERCFFFENVREESMKNGLYYFHELFHGLSKGEKVLIVLDDVGDSNQLKYLAKECGNLGDGSRVIITTKDKKLLAIVNVDKIYEVKALNFQESLQLFILHAFSQNSPKMGYEELSKEVVRYCKGIPLVLKVLGSFLKSKPVGEWESVLINLVKIPNNDIQEMLKLSYDGLDSDHQEIFLYIALFLKGEKKDNLVNILEGYGFSQSVGITTLVDRALVTISDANRVLMNDLLQDMGEKIVCERWLVESNKSGHLEDIDDLLNEIWETRVAEGLQLDVSQIKDLHLSANTFKRMSTLLMLTKLPKVYGPGNHSHNPENPVDRSIQNTKDKKHFDRGQEPLNSNTRRQLIENPDLSKVPSEVEGFDDVMDKDDPKQGDAPIEEDKSDFRVTMKVTDELELKELLQGPVNLNTSKQLIENPDLSKVPTEVEVSDDVIDKDEPKQIDAPIEENKSDFGSKMKVTDEPKLRESPQKLHSLRVEGYHFLESLPNESVKGASYVSDLYAIDCPSLKDLGGGKFTFLTTLYILNCRNLDVLLSLENFPCLEHLSIGSSCDSLKNIILNHNPKLKTLCIWNCHNLESLSISEESEHRNLESMEIRDCPSLVSFLTKGLLTPNLVSFTISNCAALKSLPNHMASNNSLRTMFIDRCPKLNSLPEGGLPSSLSLLSISFCDDLMPKKEWELNRLHSLTRFEIENVGEGMKSFPEKDLLPRNLISLRISNLSSLTNLDYDELRQLTALQSLDINCCEELSSFPDRGLPTCLVSLSVKECPLLTPNLKLKLVSNWCSIARVPNIKIDGDFFSRKK